VRTLAVVALVGCGRVAFDALPADANIDSAIAVCGDNICAGDLGELCTTCMNDCATLAQVCGNGACEAGEETVCYADCGPSPWPWTSEANEMLVALNQFRATGTICPGETMTRTGPPLTHDGSLEPFAREWAWEAAHQEWFSIDSCNGRPAGDRLTAIGASSGWRTFDKPSPMDAIATLLAYEPSCPLLMSTSNTRLATAGAHDVSTSHTVVLR
jgi:hypothetical protein